MSVIAIYGCDLLRSKNKTGALKVDAHGYREIILGAFDVTSTKGDFYVFTENVKAMFAPGGDIHRRLASAQLRGEIEHPRPYPGETMPAFMNRVRGVSLQKTSHHIKSVRLEEMKDAQGRRVIAAIGMVKPGGPYASTIESAFNNPDENVSFSIRTLSRRWVEQKQTRKEITNVITWDYVNEPGIPLATKYDTPSMESMEELPFTEAELCAAERYSDELAEAIGFEGNDGLDFAMIRSGLGWEKTQLIPARNPANW